MINNHIRLKVFVIMHYDKVFSRDVFFWRTIVRFESNAAARLRRVASS